MYDPKPRPYPGSIGARTALAWHSLEAMRLDEAEARRRFAIARVARLGTVDAAGTPHLVPVTFAVVAADGAADAVVFAVDHKPKAGRDLKRLHNIRANPAVSFLVDHYDDDWSRLWWVRADGTAAVDDARNRSAEVDALARKYSQYAEHRPDSAVVIARVTTWRGWAAS